MAEIDVLKAQLVRNDASTPWGFRLQGGAGVSAPLTIARVSSVMHDNRSIAIYLLVNTI